MTLKTVPGTFDGGVVAIGVAVMAEAGSVSSAEPSPQLTTTEPPPEVKSAVVANGFASVKVPMRVVADVEIPSMPVTEMLPEELSGASRTVTPPPGGPQRGGHAAEGRDHDAERVGCASGSLLLVGMAAQDLEDRVPGLVVLVTGVTPICCTVSVGPTAGGVTTGVPSPHPPLANVAVSSATVAWVLGSVNVASTNVPVFCPSTVVKLAVEPVTAISVTVAWLVSVTTEPPTSVTTVVMV